MKRNFSWLCLCSLLLLPCGPARGQDETPAIIPQPQKMEMGTGFFSLRGAGRNHRGGTRILADGDALQTGRYLADELRRRALVDVTVVDSGRKSGNVRLSLDTNAAGLGPEGYTLKVAPNGVAIEARTAAGLFYGAQSLLQLLPIPGTNAAKPPAVRIPCLSIEDQPRFAWRGLMLDVSRHFFTKEEVKRLLDEMAWHKLNTFHWHLVDDQGWRIEIKKYPRLTEIGAWRKGIGFGLDPKSGTAYGPDGRYGGFYTQDDIRNVVAYAQSRHITIVPEIEMPGHSSAALMAYPEFSCTGGPFTTDLPGGVFNGEYCVGNDKTYGFIDDILAEVAALFPGPYIHIGGDEVPVDNWKQCPKCQARMREAGLTNEAQLEGYFVRRVEGLVNAHHRRLIGWSEIRQGGLGSSATVMDWVGGAAEAAIANHDVVMSPLADCYFDHYQSLDHAREPRAIGGYLPLRQVYSFEPIPANLPADCPRHILGAQANLWTEYIPSFSHVEYMVFPRLCALSEVVWSPKSSRDWNDFSRRVRVDCRRLDQLGVNHRAVPDSFEETMSGEKRSTP